MSGDGQTKEYVPASLNRHIDWKGAFVIGLAGTILVTGVTGPVVGELGSIAIPLFIFTTISGVFLCYILAELAGMFPDRAGGAPAYAYVAFKRKYPKAAELVSGLTSWAYWLGWNPVIAVNMLLISSYLNALLGPMGYHFNPILTGAVLSTVLYIIAYMGIRPGAIAGNILAALCIIPLLIIALAPFVFKSELLNWSNLLPITFKGEPWLTSAGILALLKLSFLTTWNAIAMEAAACYIAECDNPGKDAPKAMAAEGLLGAFIYTMVPLSFLLVLGYEGVAADPYAMFVSFAGPIFGKIGVWLVFIMLFAALLLSALNAIMGCARSLYQMSLDGQFPRIFAHVNKHVVPDFSMAINVILNVGLMLIGVPAFVMVASNVGYVISFVPVLLAFYWLRKEAPDLERPYKLPNIYKGIAIFLIVFFLISWIVGGPLWGATYYGIGWAIMLVFFPLHWYRVKVEDKKYALKEMTTFHR